MESENNDALPQSVNPADAVESMKCRKCDMIRLSSQFNNKLNICAICNTAYTNKYKSTVKGRLTTLRLHAQSHAQSRGAKGRVAAGQFDLDQTQLEQLWKIQAGRCHYSGLLMALAPDNDWMVSLERLDNDKGYTISNVCLAVQELNGPTHWTRTKIASVPSLIASAVCIDTLQASVAAARAGGRRNNGGNNVRTQRRIETTADGMQQLNCTRCQAMFPTTSFLKSKYGCGFRSRCKSCRSHDATREKLRAFLVACINNAGQSTEHRAQKRKRENMTNENRLTLDDALDKVIAQKGRCFYSGIPLRYERNSEWQCSFERLNNSIAYEKDNVVLIALEFNTANQWSKQKFDIFLRSVLATSISQPELPQEDEQRAVVVGN